jgi:uncharacterized membrane protein
LVAQFFLAHRVAGGAGGLVVPETHDLYQHLIVMEQFDKVLRAGASFPRWLPDLLDGYGIPWTSYYHPGVYYLTSFAHLFVQDWLKATFLVAFIGMFVSGCSMYILARVVAGPPASAVAALVYMAAPYHLLDLYWRGAL